MIKVAVVGLGLMGTRRTAIAQAHQDCEVTRVYDLSSELTLATAARLGAVPCQSWKSCVQARDIDVVVVSTPNAVKDLITARALQAGKAVLAEKPPARDLSGLRTILAALDLGGGMLKVGFNYRYFRGLRAAERTLASGEIGELINYRLRHGHGGRPGYSADWRFDPVQSGGGELTDQGCHALDLALWLAGPVTRASCELQRGAWGQQAVEDNAFVTLRHGDVVGQIHVSWTSWKNQFSLEVFGTSGAVVVDGLGGSYGPQQVITFRRPPRGGPPDELRRSYPDESAMTSLEREWDDFVGAVRCSPPGPPQWREQAAHCAELIDRLYASAA